MPPSSVISVCYQVGEHIKYYAQTNEVIFVTEGTIDISYNNMHHTMESSNTIFFLRFGSFFSFNVLKETHLLIFKVEEFNDFCNRFSLAFLNEYALQNPDLINHNKNVKYTSLKIHDRLTPVFTSITNYLNDGFRCPQYLDMKSRELFMLVNVYHPLADIYNFFRLIINDDIKFTEHIRLNWEKYDSINELAESLHMSTKVFTTTFRKSFNTTPYKWIKFQRSKLIHYQLISSEKSIKEIAYENGFSTLSQFSKFCTIEIGGAPSEIRKSQSALRITMAD